MSKLAGGSARSVAAKDGRAAGQAQEKAVWPSRPVLDKRRPKLPSITSSSWAMTNKILDLDTKPESSIFPI